MPLIYEHPIVVTSADIDGQGHVSNVRYLSWMQDAAVAHSAAQGWDAPRYRAAGLSWVVRSHYIRYLRAALDEDHIVLQTWVADFKRSSSMRKYTFLRGADKLAIAETQWALIDIGARAPARIPPEMRSAFEVLP